MTNCWTHVWMISRQVECMLDGTTDFFWIVENECQYLRGFFRVAATSINILQSMSFSFASYLGRQRRSVKLMLVSRFLVTTTRSRVAFPRQTRLQVLQRMDNCLLDAVLGRSIPATTSTLPAASILREPPITQVT